MLDQMQPSICQNSEAANLSISLYLRNALVGIAHLMKDVPTWCTGVCVYRINFNHHKNRYFPIKFWPFSEKGKGKKERKEKKQLPCFQMANLCHFFQGPMKIKLKERILKRIKYHLINYHREMRRWRHV